MHRCYPFPSGFVRWQAWHRAKSDRDTRLSARFRGRHAPLGIIAHRSLASFLRLQCGSLSHLLGPDTKLVNPPIENHRGLKDRPAAQHMLAQAVQLLLIPIRIFFHGKENLRSASWFHACRVPLSPGGTETNHQGSRRCSSKSARAFASAPG